MSRVTDVRLLNFYLPAVRLADDDEVDLEGVASRPRVKNMEPRPWLVPLGSAGVTVDAVGFCECVTVVLTRGKAPIGGEMSVKHVSDDGSKRRGVQETN